MTNVHEVIIIGSGPAGWTAALYTGRARLKPMVFAGLRHGGQLMDTTEIENFPGFPEGIMGPALMDLFDKQAKRFGAEAVYKDVERVDFSRRPFSLWVEGEEHKARAVIVATGAKPRMLGLANEQRLFGNGGVSSCATCDGFFYRGKEVVVVGGGDSAMEEANFLTRFANKVTVIHRREELRASKIMQDRARANPKIAWRLGWAPVDVLGDSVISAVRLKHAKTGEVEDYRTDGMFLAIGHVPTTQVFADFLTLDDQGYIKLPGPTSATNVEGVFAAGDCVDHRYRQAVTAAGMGCMAAIDAERWLETQGH